MRQDSESDGIRWQWQFKAEYVDADKLPKRNGRQAVRQFDRRESGFCAFYTNNAVDVWYILPCRFATLSDASRAARVLRNRFVEARAVNTFDVVAMVESSVGGVPGFIDQIVADACQW